ncbi:MAG: hypothetical protein R3C59_02330 [Planctomycetaceae bacterium]
MIHKWQHGLCLGRQTLLHLLSGLLIASFVSGCSQQPERDLKGEFDVEVQQNYFRNFGTTDAIKLLEAAGVYVDSEEPDAQKLDRPHILPLLKRLKSEFGMDPIAVTTRKDPNLILAIVAELPPGVTQEEVRAMLLDAQNTFPGEILQQWGYRWLSLDFLSQQDVQDLDGL